MVRTGVEIIRDAVIKMAWSVSLGTFDWELSGDVHAHCPLGHCLEVGPPMYLPDEALRIVWSIHVQAYSMAPNHDIGEWRWGGKQGPRYLFGAPFACKTKSADIFSIS